MVYILHHLHIIKSFQLLLIFFTDVSDVATIFVLRTTSPSASNPTLQMLCYMIPAFSKLSLAVK